MFRQALLGLFSQLKSLCIRSTQLKASLTTFFHFQETWAIQSSNRINAVRFASQVSDRSFTLLPRRGQKVHHSEGYRPTSLQRSRSSPRFMTQGQIKRTKSNAPPPFFLQSITIKMKSENIFSNCTSEIYFSVYMYTGRSSNQKRYRQYWRGTGQGHMEFTEGSDWHKIEQAPQKEAQQGRKGRSRRCDASIMPVSVSVESIGHSCEEFFRQNSVRM